MPVGGRRSAEQDGGERRGLCAICDQTNATVRLCRRCQADPANAGWSQRTMQGEQAALGGPVVDRDAVELAAGAGRTDVHERPPRRPSRRTQQILQLVGFYQITEYVRPRGRLRARHEWLPRRRPLHLAEVAFLLGISESAVRQTLRRDEPLMLAALRARTPRGRGE